MRLSGIDIQQATQGHWRGKAPEAIHGIVTDSRDFPSGNTFLALRGPHFDGHTFASELADRAEALIGDHEGVRLWDHIDIYQLEVADTLKAMGDIAHAWRKTLKQTTLIAISGSYGKTSLRSLLEHGFHRLGLRVAATKANLNNLIGVPQTLLSIDQDADIALIECGISEVGEMRRLASMVQPDIAIITGLASAHSEGLGGLQGVAREKTQILDALPSDGWCILGEGVEHQLREFDIDLPRSAISMTKSGDQKEAVSWQLNGTCLTLTQNGKSADIQLALPARHWAANMALASSMMLRYMHQRHHKTTLAAVAKALSDWQPVAGRMRQTQGLQQSVILDDSYNANPVSMQAALDTLVAMDGHRVAILGDMAELGTDSDQAHAGLEINGIEQVFLIGHEMRMLAEKHDSAQWFATTEEAIRFFLNFQPNPEDIILIKASRSMGLDRIAALLEIPGEEMRHAV